MINGAIYRQRDGICLLPQVMRTASAWDRMRGLLARPALKSGEGLLISPCRTVHTFGMRHALDLVFLDRHGRVCKLVPDLAPGRFAGSIAASMTLELASGSLKQIRLSVGEQVEWRTTT